LWAAAEARRNRDAMEGRHPSPIQSSSKVEAKKGRLSDFFMLADEVIPA
jgi:hypothetical protein